jgi:hypothetical protein
MNVRTINASVPSRRVARGILRHMFHGEYRVKIVLQFAHVSDAIAVQRILGGNWMRATDQTKPILTWSGTTGELNVIKSRLAEPPFSVQIEPCGCTHCRRKGANQPIDSITHSMDYGPKFYLSVDGGA